MHVCAVCWARQPSHTLWFEHVTEAHDASVGDFGWRICLGTPRAAPPCPGIRKKAPTEGHPPVRRVRPAPAPFKAKDGTTYTPQSLWEGEHDH